MKQSEIQKLTDLAGMEFVRTNSIGSDIYQADTEELLKFAEIIRSAVLEEAAKLCEVKIAGWKADQKENLANQCKLQAEINELREKLAEQTEFAKNAAENYEAMHDELTNKLAEQKLVIFDYEMADYKGQVAMLKAKLAEIESKEPAAHVVFDPVHKEYEFISTWPESCHEHINDAINDHDIEGAGEWVVRPLYLSAGAKPNE